MARLIILGSAASVSDMQHDHTHFILLGDHGNSVLVDCGSNPVGKLQRYNLGVEHPVDTILTHFHPDHVFGIAPLLMQLWLMGRTSPMQIYGIHHCIQRVEEMMAAYLWETWPRFYPVQFEHLPERENELVLDNADFYITAWPTKHFIPTIGLRIEVKTSGKVISYSCDTEPVPAIVRLAQDADLLLHESAGEGSGHSSAAQAGAVAAQARARQLTLIHYDVRKDIHRLAAEAQTTFDGLIDVAEDYAEYAI